MIKYRRRQFITTAAAIAASPLIFAQMIKEKKSAKIIHHVFFWLKNAGSESDKKKLIEGLKTLKAINEVKQLLIGTPASTLKRDVVDNSYDLSELIYFESIFAQDIYQVHPVHKEFVEKYSHLWEKVTVYDMLLEEGITL